MNDAVKLMRLLEFSDSAFPVGAFAFSNGLESASQSGIVHDAATLEAFAADLSRQAAFTDGIAALHAFRSAAADDYEGVLAADGELLRCRIGTETRRMLCRMGRKLGELASRIAPSPMISRWLADIGGGAAAGTYPVGQGILFAAAGLSERALFCSHQYGVVNMALGAALRCVRVSHYDTQRILFSIAAEAESLYAEVEPLSLEDMNAFVPRIDILASIHEKGSSRMFMN